MKVLCLVCKENEVERWNIPCAPCRKARKLEREERKRRISIQRRMPAAIIEPEGAMGTQVFVDKHGREVDNPGYDLKNDEFGWKFSGRKPKDRTVIK